MKMRIEDTGDIPILPDVSTFLKSVVEEYEIPWSFVKQFLKLPSDSTLVGADKHIFNDVLCLRVKFNAS